jgi:hypothetical protein
MKHPKFAILILATLLAALGVSAQEPGQTTEDSGSKPAEQAGAGQGDPESVSAPESPSPPVPGAGVVYQPPARGRPAHTVGGATRGTGDKVPVLFVVTPDHVGQTTSAQPSLFWYIDRVPDAAIQIEFTLLDEESIKPLAEGFIVTPKGAGVHRIRLADYGVRLSRGVEYEWSVALILDPNDRSKDVVATGWIDRVEPSAQLTSRLEAEGRERAAAVYANEGIWYDAFAALSDQIDRNPEDDRLRQYRTALLRQVGLDQAASGEGS